LIENKENHKWGSKFPFGCGEEVGSMSILYVIKEKLNPQDREARGKFYLQSKIRGHKSYKSIIKSAMRNTTLNVNELDMALTIWFEEGVRALSKGFSVEAVGLGTFTVSIQSKGAETEDETTAANKESLKLNCRLNPETRELVNKFSLEKIDLNKTL
jgi:nucleoid DNA-binding protein